MLKKGDLSSMILCNEKVLLKALIVISEQAPSRYPRV